MDQEMVGIYQYLVPQTEGLSCFFEVVEFKIADLPNEMRQSVDIKVFRSLIKTWSGNCSCAFCDH